MTAIWQICWSASCVPSRPTREQSELTFEVGLLRGLPSSRPTCPRTLPRCVWWSARRTAPDRRQIGLHPVMRSTSIGIAGGGVGVLSRLFRVPVGVCGADADGRPRARLLDLVAGRSGKTYRDWLDARGQQFRDGVKEATLDPFHGYKNAIDDQLADAVAVLDAFHVVKLATTAVDECRRRLQHQIHGHRGRKDDPLYRIRNILRAASSTSPTGNKPA